MRVTGRLTGHTLIPGHIEARELDPGDVLERFRGLPLKGDTCPSGGTGTFPAEDPEEKRSDV